MNEYIKYVIIAVIAFVIGIFMGDKTWANFIIVAVSGLSGMFIFAMIFSPRNTKIHNWFYDWFCE